MNLAYSTLRLFFGERRRRVVEEDPADMGTCFGMEMSLEPDPPAPTAPEPQSERESGWWQRLGSRKPLGA